MKPLLVLSYVVFLVAFTINTQPTTGAEGPVYDVRGKRVLNDSPYYIGPVNWAKGGGIKLTDTINNKKICPSYVVQDPAEVNKGGAFLFTMLTYSGTLPHKKHLRTERALGIDSGRPKEGSCERWTFWQITDLEAKPPSNLVTTGGVYEDDYSCFQVVDYPKATSPKVHSYMLQHCPSYCGTGGPELPCYNISLYENKGVRYLAPGGTPFEFVFQKAK